MLAVLRRHSVRMADMQKLLLLMLLIPCTRPAIAAPQNESQKQEIGSINFFGYGGIDISTLRAHLPVQVGNLVSVEHFGRYEDEINKVVLQQTGKPTTDISAVCCGLEIYIGLTGTSSRPMPKGLPMRGEEHLDPSAINLYDQYGEALASAVARGVSREDQSHGYALSLDPSARAIQLKVRAYALDREAELERVLGHAKDDKQRAAAAYFLGYAR